MLKVPNLRKRPFPAATGGSPVDPVAAAEQIRAGEPDTLRALSSILRHPRSLARPLPTWRPPSKQLPAVMGGRKLNATLSRHRVGPKARARVRGFGESREPTHVISIRFTDPQGRMIPPGFAEAWIRALVPSELIDTVHEISSGRTPTYCWLVDAHQVPLRSPSSLFSGMENAA